MLVYQRGKYQCPASQASRPRIVNSATNARAAANSSAASAAAGAAAVAGGTGAGAPVGTEDWDGGLPAADPVENSLSWVQNEAKLKQNVYISIYIYNYICYCTFICKIARCTVQTQPFKGD